jgi:catechol 2,3-dioxygenase-like lactoylglutathione lyase family enzyme
MGVTIGVSDIEKSRKIYQEGMQYDSLAATGEKGTFRNAWLKPSKNRASAFSQLLGPTQLELVCDTAGGREQIFKDRFWGDLGFIHVCFDVQRMHQLREFAKTLNHPFTVDSENSFDMGEAAGQFAYVEDNDKTLIELVETHKVPIMKKLGWYINVKNKKVQKPLPKLIFKVLSLNRVK